MIVEEGTVSSVSDFSIIALVPPPFPVDQAAFVEVRDEHEADPEPEGQMAVTGQAGAELAPLLRRYFDKAGITVMV